MKRIFLYLLLFLFTFSYGQKTTKKAVYIKGTSIVSCDSGIIVKAGFEPEAVAYFNAMTTQWDAASKVAINTFIKSQKASGLWAKKDRIFLFASTSADDCVIDLKGTENASLVNSPTFTQYRGVTAATGTYINSNFNPVSDGVNYTLNSCGVAYWLNNDLAVNAADQGHNNSTQYFLVRTRTATSFLSTPPYQAAATLSLSTAVTNSIGLFSIQRTANNASNSMSNDGVNATSATASSALVNNDYYIGAPNNNGTAGASVARQWSYFEFRAGLNLAEAATNRTQINTLLSIILNK